MNYPQPIVQVYISTWNGEEVPVYGFLATGDCATCDAFFPHGPQHYTKHGNHCSCDGCF